MAKNFRRVEVGTTVQFTWVGSTAPSSLTLAIKTATETLVSSGPAVQSGGGSWYRFVTIPDSFGRYPCDLTAEWTATASTHVGTSSPFVTRQLIKVVKTKAYGVSDQ